MKKNGDHEAGRWLAQAEQDRMTVEVLEKGGRFYMACFLSQQVAEKCLKAFLYAQGQDPVFGHSVATLCMECAEYDKAFKKFHSEIKNLDQYYIEARYPNGLPDGIPADFFNQQDAALARNMAEKVMRFVKKKVKNA